MILIGLVNLKKMKGGAFLLSILFCFCCAPNKNVIITDLNNVENTYSKTLSNQKYGITFYSLGGKKYKKVNKYRFYNQKKNEEIFVIRNDIGGNLIYEGLFKIENPESYLTRLKEIKNCKIVKKNTIIYDEKSIDGTEYSYIIGNKKIKEFIFNKNESLFTYVVQINKQSPTIKYNINRYLEQALEGINLNN
ncbi:hypothetical protein SAMN05421664_1011 [Chryseobacterium soldanellicola]|uniref:Uncharacterized protein n=2 Tax=Chryseobacterium soldanellicola TaxID=311333 RepID=A0A1H0ZPP3_9FLAO|nr:hypothetical protein SAMN05421664_1011 [Chryseobacterium soldanellicola]